MDMKLDFGRGLVAQVTLDNISEGQYARIVKFFGPMINDPLTKSREAIGRTGSSARWEV